MLQIHAQPGRVTVQVLSWFLFAVGLAAYFWISTARHHENADDRVTPTLVQMGKGFTDAILKPAEEDELTADADTQPLFTKIRNSMLWKDTAATGRRFAISLALLFPAVLLGLHMGMFPYVGTFFLRFVLFFDKIVALSLLPILFIAFGIDELAKVMLIVIGVAPTIILDAFNLTRGVPREQVVKGFTLGAGDFSVFAGEMIASSDGLAYRIALLRRHMGMDTIIPYVLWVALLLFLVDLGMRVLNRRLHPWFQEA